MLCTRAVGLTRWSICHIVKDPATLSLSSKDDVVNVLWKVTNVLKFGNVIMLKVHCVDFNGIYWQNVVEIEYYIQGLQGHSSFSYKLGRGLLL